MVESLFEPGHRTRGIKYINPKNFQALVDSIGQYGFQSNNLLTVSKDKQDPDKHVVYDGNRRLAAVKKNTDIQELSVYEENGFSQLNAILSREHSTDAAGRLQWTSVQQAKYDRNSFTNRKEQGLLENNENPSSRVQALAVLEASLPSKPLNSSFNLTTFDRLYSSNGFKDSFGVDVSDIENTSVTSPVQIRTIFSDIEDGRINSRNTNTSTNKQQYLTNVLQKITDDKQRCELKEDGEYDEEKKEDNPTRLFTPSVFNDIEKLWNNDMVIKELQLAPVSRYPNLLNLATRAMLDSLHNENKRCVDDSKPAVSLNQNQVAVYLTNTPYKKRIKEAQILIDRLCQHAHDFNKYNRTHSDINNDRDLVQKLIDVIGKEINKKRE